jgi:hypothetical protein
MRSQQIFDEKFAKMGKNDKNVIVTLAPAIFESLKREHFETKVSKNAVAHLNYEKGNTSKSVCSHKYTKCFKANYIIFYFFSAHRHLKRIFFLFLLMKFKWTLFLLPIKLTFRQSEKDWH